MIPGNDGSRKGLIDRVHCDLKASLAVKTAILSDAIANDNRVVTEAPTSVSRAGLPKTFSLED